MKRVLLTLACLALAACGTNDVTTPLRAPEAPGLSKNVNLGSPFNLDVGESATVRNEGGLTVTFNGVDADSRCPSDVECFWEGDAEVNVTISKPGYTSLNTVLHTSLTPQSASYNGYTVTLNGLAPYPVSTSTIDPNDYVATFTVTKP
jgi:hypothetical protein